MTRTVTALRAASPGRVAVELDGVPWRTLPLEAVMRAGLGAGRALDRITVRVLAREVRRLQALDVAGKALRSRDRSVAELAARLEARGIAAADRAQTLTTLEAAGVVDDGRFAASRARALADRGSGDALIEYDLEQRGVGADAIRLALEALPPERLRADRIVARRGPGLKTARYLIGKGFGEDSLEGVVAVDPGDSVG